MLRRQVVNFLGDYGEWGGEREKQVDLNFRFGRRGMHIDGWGRGRACLAF